MRKTALALAALVGFALALGATPEAPPPAAPPQRPKVVLVLSGGGARGAAHIGVIKVLEDLHVRPDMVVGTSMGSIIGGLYAAGWSSEEIESTITTIDWNKVFVDSIPREYRTLRRKQDDTFLVPLKMRFKDWKPYIPPSVIGGQALELQLQRFEIEATGERDFDKFPIPYRAVAADFGTGDPFVISHGSLSTAMRASMSVPGVFPPVEIDGVSLCDGGVAANFPVRIAKQLGAEVVIGVDISSPLSEKDARGNLLQRLNQTTSLLTAGNVKDDKAALSPRDVLIVPDLGDLGFSDFDRSKEAIAIGERSARAVADKLSAYAVPDEEWREYMARHVRRPVSDTVVDRVEIVNSTYLSDAIVHDRLDMPTGGPLDEDKLANRVLHAYSLDTFGIIHHELVRDADGKNVLRIEAPPKPYSRNSLQFGFNFEDDFQGDVRFNLAVSHLYNPINKKGGEWRNILQFGDDSALGTELYQPLDVKMKWFVQPHLGVRQDKFGIFNDEGDALAEYFLNQADARVGAGRVFGEWGRLQLGVFRTSLRAERRIGLSILPEASYNDGGAYAEIHVDSLDNFVWPTHGMRADGIWQQSYGALGATQSGSSWHLDVARADKFGRNVLFVSARVDRSGQDLVSPTIIALGGLFNLSGLKTDELIGSKGGIGKILYYRELTSFSLGSLTQRMYAGASFEAGNAYMPADAVTWPSLRRAGSIFVGADTILGPAYFGVGYTEGNRFAVYLIIGQRL